MPTSQNGYSANDRSVIAAFTIPGTIRRISLRKGDTSVILLDLFAWIHANIEPIDTGVLDDWGYAERTIRGSSTTLSNHASGTAGDANATQHPLGVRGTWTADERRRINARLALYEGCVRWGDNYDGRVDGMHFEIDRGAAACKAVADRIRVGRLGGIPAVTTSTPSAPPKPKGIPKMIERRLTVGNNHGRIVCPAEARSKIASEVWVSVSGEGGCKGRVAFQTNSDTDGAPAGSGPAWDLALRNGNRAAKRIPATTEFLEYWVTVNGVQGSGEGSLLVEFVPR